MDDIMMDNAAQVLYLNAIMSSPELFAKVNPILKSEYFDTGLQGPVRFVQEYFDKNRGVPSEQIFKAATKVSPEIFNIPRQDVQYLAEQIAGFCQASAMIMVARKSPGLIESKDYNGLIEQFKMAAQIGLLEDLGIEYFDNPLARLERAETTDAVISTGWKDVDALIGGGVGRQELITFLAPSGGGKSVSMLNYGYNLLQQGLHGVYVTIEMRDSKVALRADQIISRIGSGMINANRSKVAHDIQLFGERTGSRFFIKRMREGVTNANHISAYLRELESTKAFRPDFVIIDYLDILESARKCDGNNMFLKDKYVTEEVRGIGYDYDCIMISASQLGKHATEAINEGKMMHQGDIQGGSSKTNTADLIIATVKTAAMDAAGEYRFEFPKARNSGAQGKTCSMKWDPNTLRISDGSAPDLSLKKKPVLQMSDIRPGSAKKTLSDLGNI
jgi:KaiC/GvpD/RAD55 family RecA-like ATPase